MSKPLWLNVSPTSGSGNGTISNSASKHTGRVARTGIVTVTATGVSTPETYNVTQTPSAEFVSFNDGDSMSVSKGGGTITIQGKSNSSKLTFAWVGESYEVELPAQYTAAGLSTNNGTAIAGDPGASSEFVFAIELEVPLNDTIEEVTRTLKVTANSTNVTKQIAIVQAAGDPRISLSTNSITIDTNGTAVSVNVSSNTTWTVS